MMMDGSSWVARFYMALQHTTVHRKRTTKKHSQLTTPHRHRYNRTTDLLLHIAIAIATTEHPKSSRICPNMWSVWSLVLPSPSPHRPIKLKTNQHVFPQYGPKTTRSSCGNKHQASLNSRAFLCRAGVHDTREMSTIAAGGCLQEGEFENDSSPALF